MGDLLALAERCEKAARPDRELDAEIDIAVCGFPENAYCTANAMRAKGTPHLDRIQWFIKWGAKHFTASLDAARTLVPEGLQWATGSLYEKGPWAWCDTEENSRFHDLHYAKGTTPALALCAAALRARHAIESAA